MMVPNPYINPAKFDSDTLKRFYNLFQEGIKFKTAVQEDYELIELWAAAQGKIIKELKKRGETI